MARGLFAVAKSQCDVKIDRLLVSLSSRSRKPTCQDRECTECIESKQVQKTYLPVVVVC